MAHLFSAHSMAKSFGAQLLFEKIDLFIHQDDKIGLVGPNGSGKSTLLKIICELESSDEGIIQKKKHLVTGYLAQEDIFEENLSVFDNLLSVFKESKIDQTEQHVRAQTMMSRGEFRDPQLPVRNLSGGWRKRLSICRSLITHSDILVMDEPTNHLDMEGILWLEEMLNATFPESPSAYILVSHDRRFLDNCTNKTIELSPSYPQGSLQVDGNYSQFVHKKEEFLSNQIQLEGRLAGKVRRENEWLGRGPKARTTKARYRVDEAYRLQDELQAVRSRNRASSAVQLGFDSTGRKTKKLLETCKLTKRLKDSALFSDLDMVFSPGTRLGLLGRNGCGKSTLMRILAAAGHSDIHEDYEGTIKVADGIRIVMFDQKREQIDKGVTLRRALAPEGDSVVYRGRSIHVVSWAKRFLFRTDQLETPVAQLSGGEQARILIAGLMLRPADILLLDEPTNDLDISSLDVLEESLLSFPGALVLVTHDRYLLDRVCERVLGFDATGGVSYYADYRQYLAAMNEQENLKEILFEKKKQKEKPKKVQKRKTARLSYLDQREYDMMEEKIMEAEIKESELRVVMEQPDTVADPERLHECWLELEAVQKKIEQLYARWDELEQKKEES